MIDITFIYTPLFIEIYPSFHRYPGFSYFCKCSEKCFDKDPFFCDVTKYGTKGCKFCRFMRCKYLAGMVDNLVISANLPAATEKIVDHNMCGSKCKTENSNPVKQCGPSNIKRKRLKYCIYSEGNDKVILNFAMHRMKNFARLH